MNSQVIQALNCFKYLKSSGAFEAFETRLLRSAREQSDLERRKWGLDALLGGLHQPLAGLILIILVAWDHVFRHDPVSSALVALLVIYKIMNTLIAVQSQWQQFSAVRGHLDNVLESTKDFESHREVFTETIDEIGVPSPAGWSFRDVSLDLNGRKILHDCTFIFPERGLIGIAGRSGGGKSTLLDVMSGLLIPSDGELRDSSGRRHPFQSLRMFRPSAGVVTQDPFLFSGTLLFNVTLDQERMAELSTEQGLRLQAALERSSCHEFLPQLKDGLETMCGDGHVQLSGGQKQRIALAREIFKDPGFFLLDEATSALDVASESEVLRGLESLSFDKPVLLVTHRPNVLKKCDEIWVVDDGRIMQKGTYERLMADVGGAFEDLMHKDRSTPVPHPRFGPGRDEPFLCTVEKNGRSHDLATVNISLTGIGLKPAQDFSPPKLDEVMAAVLHLPEGDESVLLRVIHASDAAVGARFLDLRPETAASIRAYIGRKSAA